VASGFAFNVSDALIPASVLEYPKLTKAEIESCKILESAVTDEVAPTELISIISAVNKPAFPFNSVTILVASFGPIPDTRVNALLSPVATAIEISFNPKDDKIAIPTLAPTP
jgi:hypothetical protein